MDEVEARIAAAAAEALGPKATESAWSTGLSSRYRTSRANRSVTPAAYREERWSPSNATSTTSSGRTFTTCPSSLSASSPSRSVCQASTSSVIPLNVLPSITSEPSGSRAPRCRFDSFPARRP